MDMSALRIAAYTTLAMIAFAGNSVLCRLALVDGAIEPLSFTAIRLLAAALTLALILVWRDRRLALTAHGSWQSAITLIVYAVFFSYAYVSLSAASGALLLFGLVQATMIARSIREGEHPSGTEWLGWGIAALGLILLLLPGATAPSPVGALMMAVAGVGWGLYSLYGRSEPRPLASTTGNFARLVLPACLIGILGLAEPAPAASGVSLALISGALTTGVGYVIWYAALPSLSGLQAAVVQLSVPAIATIGGAVLIDEPITLRLALTGLLILGGISVALTKRHARSPG